MRPGNLYPYAQIVLQVGLPLILLSALAICGYGYLRSPLRQLHRATRAFSQGELDARTQASSGFIGWRNDEITRLGVTFNDMASRTARLIS
ncbi:HAMP domain-containing protein, partial [Staphylococcus pasteuri_A]|uniref:HAMP domain-containing protein n=1 Tax=Staphylococcus pasteuri_A TaxID=3062664 RepID=UPI0034C67002